MLRLILGVVIALAAASAAGAGVSGSREALLSWTRPTQYVNGTTLPASRPLKYRIYRGTSPTSCSGFSMLVETSALQLLLTNQPLGRQCYCVTAVDVMDESLRTGPGCKTMRLSAPTEGSIEKPTEGSIER
jgi:hypothetical protein